MRVAAPSFHLHTESWKIAEVHLDNLRHLESCSEDRHLEQPVLYWQALSPWAPQILHNLDKYFSQSSWTWCSHCRVLSTWIKHQRLVLDVVTIWTQFWYSCTCWCEILLQGNPPKPPTDCHPPLTNFHWTNLGSARGASSQLLGLKPKRLAPVHTLTIIEIHHDPVDSSLDSMLERPKPKPLCGDTSVMDGLHESGMSKQQIVWSNS